MYDKRVKIFIGMGLSLLLIALLRLVQMQLLADSSLQDEIAALKRQRGRSRQLNTLRGQILDRKGRVLATDSPQFQIAVDYRLTRFYDDRVVEAMELLARDRTNPSVLYDLQKEVEAKRSDLQRIIHDCSAFGADPNAIERRIRSLNDEKWNLRTFIAWVRGGPDPNLVARYGGRINSIPPSEAEVDFERRYPDRADRLRRIARVDDLAGMYDSEPLLELETEDDIFAAQIEFMDINDVSIVPKGQRQYPYGSTAAQTIGWVGPAEADHYTELLKHDRLASYREGEVCGRRPGVEYVCEAILRGRRGELVYDIDRKLIRQSETVFGKDVQLTLDIELQRRIENYITDRTLNPNYLAPSSVVVIQVRTGDVLALVSTPTYDLNRVRYDYGALMGDPNHPLWNRAISQQYPPGSSIKPLILIAGLEEKVVAADEIISCPSAPAPPGWPNCLIYRNNRFGHDVRWDNIARNAIKGSCNIYFTHAADRLDRAALQQWLYRFGYGHRVPLNYPPAPSDEIEPRQLIQAQGQISWKRPETTIASFEDIPALRDVDKRLFGIGQGNLWASPLQVANSFATLARGGLARPPRLFLQPQTPGRPEETVDLNISPETLQVVYDGMNAVVNETGGSGQNAFRPSGLARQGVKVLGKTGSTERPYHAWFAGFAEDDEGAKIAFAVLIEGGQQGSRDAAPVARDVIQFCVDAGYVGTPSDMPIPTRP
ncbi:penicillin-binding transpeptidase domain-containing protein [Anaerobaca lacustris]|uniref:beta-lactamase n=1 Tax=Anaerobaca lacustris TaxID=3044600 RepID=A0AAW6TXP6_9BACT|nr:penicillin-binding transpeptidase domain-containing protein [Sedimentisphaerales bacterium M17dextr]